MMTETFDAEFIIRNLDKLFMGLTVTFRVMLIALLIGWFIGLLGAIGKIYGSKKLKAALDFVTDLIRGIPTIVLIFVVYFGGLALRKSLFGISAAGANKEIFAAIALSIYTGQGGFLNNCQNIWHGVIRHEKKNRKNKNICYNSGSQHGP